MRRPREGRAGDFVGLALRRSSRWAERPGDRRARDRGAGWLDGKRWSGRTGRYRLPQATHQPPGRSARATFRRAERSGSQWKLVAATPRSNPARGNTTFSNGTGSM